MLRKNLLVVAAIVAASLSSNAWAQRPKGRTDGGDVIQLMNDFTKSELAKGVVAHRTVSEDGSTGRGFILRRNIDPLAPNDPSKDRIEGYLGGPRRSPSPNEGNAQIDHVVWGVYPTKEELKNKGLNDSNGVPMDPPGAVSEAFLVDFTPNRAPKGERADMRVVGFYERVLVGEGPDQKVRLRPFAWIRMVPLEDGGYWVNRVFRSKKGSDQESLDKARTAVAVDRMYEILMTMPLHEFTQDGTPINQLDSDLSHWRVELDHVKALKAKFDEQAAVEAAKTR